MFPAPPKLRSNHCLGICFLGVPLQNTIGVQETSIYSSKPLSSSTFWNLLRLFCALIFSMWSIFMSISWAVGKNAYTLFSGCSWIYIDQFYFKLCHLDLSYAFWLFIHSNYHRLKELIWSPLLPEGFSLAWFVLFCLSSVVSAFWLLLLCNLMHRYS